MNPGFIFVVFFNCGSGDWRRGSLTGFITFVTEYASAEGNDSRERFVTLDESGLWEGG
jgi:hypothetical protein